jgi:hypothetical protein
MHKISKILKEKEINFADFKKIKKEWEELTTCTQKTKASCFYKQAKKHLTGEQKFSINSICSEDMDKFRSFLKILEQEFLFEQKEKIVKLVKINALQKNSKIEKAIKDLLVNLQEDQKFIKEIQSSMNQFNSGIKF